MKISVMISFLLVVLGLVAAQPQLSGYDFCNTLVIQTDTSLTNTTLYYQYCYSIRQPDIFFGVVCEIDGWCGIGVSITGLMVGINNEPSDVYVGFRNSSNLPQVGDLIIRGRNAPTQCSFAASACADGSNSASNPNGACSNNARNVNVTKVGNYTITEFSRPLAASDACDITITPGSQIFILGAMGPVSAAAYPSNILRHTFHSLAGVPVTFNLPTTSGLVTTGATQSPVTTGSVTTGLAVTTGVAPVTTGVAPVTTGVAPVTTGVEAPVTTGVAPITTGLAPPVTTGTAPAPITSGDATTGDEESTGDNGAILGIGAITAFALLF